MENTFIFGSKIDRRTSWTFSGNRRTSWTYSNKRWSHDDYRKIIDRGKSNTKFNRI